MAACICIMVATALGILQAGFPFVSQQSCTADKKPEMEAG
jgi:hypothetical protein